MLAAAIRVDAGVKADIRAVIVGNDALGGIVEKLCQGRGCIVVVVRQIRDPLDCFEAIPGIAGRSPAVQSTRSFHRTYPSAWGGAGAAAPAAGVAGEIGRASCRERVWMAAGAGWDEE